MSNTAIIITAFGTADYTALNKVTAPLISLLKKSYNEIHIAFTSDILSAKTGVPTPEVLSEQLFNNGFNKVICLSLHMVRGLEYNKLVHKLYTSDNRQSIFTTVPIINSDKDIVSLYNIIKKNLYQKDSEHIFMAHGTAAFADIMYNKLNREFINNDILNVHIASLEGNMKLQDIRLQNRRIILHPLTIFSGMHTVRDMQGIWKPELEKRGNTVKCDMRGLGELNDIQKMLISKIHSANNVAAVFKNI